MGDVHFCLAMMKFSDFIFDQGLIDIHLIFYQGLIDIRLVGSNFTWSNNQDPPSWSRIDKFLSSPYWEA